jgi:hypothetical protein
MQLHNKSGDVKVEVGLKKRISDHPCTEIIFYLFITCAVDKASLNKQGSKLTLFIKEVRHR